MKLSETTEGLNVSAYVKFQTSISFFMSNTQPETWGPIAEYSRFRSFPPFLEHDIWKSVYAMIIKRSEIMKGMNVSVYLKLQTSISYFMSDTRSQSCSPSAQNTNL